MQPKTPKRRRKPTFSPAIPTATPSDEAPAMSPEAAKAVERLNAALDEAKIVQKTAKP